MGLRGRPLRVKLEGEQLLLTDEQRRWFPGRESIPGEDVVKVVEMIPEDSQHHRNLVHVAAAGSQRTDSYFEGSSTVGKMLLNSIACYREIVRGRKSQSMQPTCRWSNSKELPQPLQPSAITTLISRQPSASRQDLPPVKRL